MRWFRHHLKCHWPLYLFLIGVWPALAPVVARADQQALELKGVSPFIRLNDTGTGQVYELMNNAGVLQLRDVNASTPRLSITSGGVGSADLSITVSGEAIRGTPLQYNRVADGNWVSNVDQNTNARFHLIFPSFYRTTSGKGLQVTSLTVSETITATALQLQTLGCNTTTYVALAAHTITSVPVTVTLPTASSTVPQFFTVTITTPAVMATANTLYSCDLNVLTSTSGSPLFTLNSVTWNYSRID